MGILSWLSRWNRVHFAMVQPSDEMRIRWNDVGPMCVMKAAAQIVGWATKILIKEIPLTIKGSVIFNKCNHMPWDQGL